jgi:lysophospholipase L1-like esterase
LRWRSLLPALALSAAACGDSPTAPAPPPGQFHTVSARVFYDANGNAMRDADEPGIVPGAEVQLAGALAAAQPMTGLATLEHVRAGTWVASVRAGSLPRFYLPGPPQEVVVPLPEGEQLELSVTLPIGANRPGTYMAFGDSITEGEGSSDWMGYRSLLQPRLVEHFGQAVLVDASISGTRSNAGAARVGASLRGATPAYTLIHYGTNDWNDPRCRTQFPCFTIESLRIILRAARAAQSLPVLATIIPVNTGYDARAPESRNQWVAAMNDLVRPLAEEEGALLVDSFAAFMATEDFHRLFVDHVHPNDQGYQIMTEQFFQALTRPVGGGTEDLSWQEPIDPLGLAPGRTPGPPADAPAHRPPRSRGPFRRPL